MGRFQYELQLFSHLNGGLHRISVIPLPNEMKYVGHVVHTPENNFVISYSTTFPDIKCRISILSGDGERLIRTFEPGSGSVLENLGAFRFDIDDDRQIFVADIDGDKVICLNSNLEDYQILSQDNRENKSPCNLVYIPEKRQLLVQTRKTHIQIGYEYSIYVFHLSPCNLVQRRK